MSVIESIKLGLINNDNLRYIEDIIINDIIYVKYFCKNNIEHLISNIEDVPKKGIRCQLCYKIPFDRYDKLISNNGGTLITKESEYKDTKSKIKYLCKHNHECETQGSNLLQKYTCLQCNSSISERTCRIILEYLYKVKFPKNRDYINPKTQKYIEIDGYNKELKIAFEYNGRQHYERVECWQTEEEFKNQQERDIYLVNLCIRDNIIPFTVNYENLYTYIVDQIPNNNFSRTIDYTLLNITSYNDERLNELKELVEEKFNGQILSTVYVNYKSNTLKCKCSKGHEFTTSDETIKDGYFCKMCSGRNVLFNIETFCNKFNYTCKSKFINRDALMNWECNKCKEIIGRKWGDMQKCNIHKCKTPPVPKIQIQRTKILQRIETFCNKYNYKLLSVYTHCKDNLQWQCTVCNTIIKKSWSSLEQYNYRHLCNSPR